MESSGLSCGLQDVVCSSLTGHVTGHVITSQEHFREEGQTGRTKADWATRSEPLLFLLAWEQNIATGAEAAHMKMRQWAESGVAKIGDRVSM